ncbi:hypothetical protein HDU97_003758 [Phlyctochytrium planicorne]|nr:hypothetical protein HDU97_003758 [Phlyctochytrium planicorne]
MHFTQHYLLITAVAGFTIVNSAAADKTCPVVTCPAVAEYPPKCLSDGRAFFNTCEFNAAKACDDSLKQVDCPKTVTFPYPSGTGVPTPTPTHCTLIACPDIAEFPPKCLSDGSSYLNQCSLTQAKNCKGLSEAPCPTGTATTSLPSACPTIRACPAIADTARCLSDGSVYYNSCELGYAINCDKKGVKEVPCGPEVPKYYLPSGVLPSTSATPTGTKGNIVYNGAGKVAGGAAAAVAGGLVGAFALM